ncbi:lysophospholipase [Fusarium oxysporum f. sp. lycopersici 4287]|uniref:Lysophospholipase n=1 Tax=Fusarium oxysporum f. sp. lycopersici (strain 4287 / CBS 123668 / FGSC 9935 / NRRL 34936) TaxID=426428 RepID=A0A0J9UZ51_FUSO4|nr:lysophospholipase [Fusarium oxysporum f. sp. lycopersici 4287]KNB04609.1 lysophospholipase [Fusarium oxysporum f. sp. lycopersici 4287]
MATRELLVVILNHTNEELNLEPQSPSLDHGHWIDAPDSRPPQMILAGESGMLRCKSSHIGGGVQGSVTYRVVGFEANNRVTFLWNVTYVGPNKFDYSCAIDAFTVKVLGGRGSQAVVVFVFAFLVSPAVAQYGTTNGEVLSFLAPRAVTDAPNGYAPGRVSCPQRRPIIRKATTLSTEETSWLKLRGNNTISALKDVLTRANIGDIDTDAYVNGIVSDGGELPRIGIAISGGGYRAMMNGAGAIAAFDNRTTNSTDKGHLGGILQAATYLSGLSGGSWAVGSLYVQNFTTVESIIYASSGLLDSLWQFDNSIIEGPADLSVAQYYRELYQDVKDKADAGYNKTITDYWGRALSYQLVNASDGGPAYTFSSIANDIEFVAATAPMPIIVAVERTSGQLQIAGNSTIIEFNPWEMGSYDPGLAAFAPLKYIGSDFSNGTIKRDGNCIAGVDNAGFVMGTSSSLFNQAFLQIEKAENVPDFLLKAINNTLADIGEENKDIANWPNPFYKYNPRNNLNANSTVLTLVDGGEDLQNIPLHPLLLSERQVDVIFAVDGSADTTTHWPNGTALVATYQSSKEGASTQNSEFPKVPDQNTFINLGLNKRPTFFGCNTHSNNSGPVIVYLPNTPYTYQSNFTTFDLEYSDTERDEIIRNGYNVATMGNATVDSVHTPDDRCRRDSKKKA